MRRVGCVAWLGMAACGGSVGGADLSLAAVPDQTVTERVRPLLPEGAVLARSVTEANVGLDATSYLAVWATKEPLTYAAGVVSGGQLHPLPPLLSAEDAKERPHPTRIGAVMLVQADADPAGEIVILLDYSESRPNRLLASAQQSFVAVVIDRTPEGFQRVPAWEEAVAGMSKPNDIRARLEPGATGF